MKKITKEMTYDIRYGQGARHSTSKWVIGVFLALLTFIFVFFPIFGLNWRYEIGGILSIIIDTVGSLCLTVGGLLTLVGFVGIFSRSPNWTRNVIVGVTLLWIGCWCTGAVINFFGTLIGESTSSGGSGWH